MADDDFITLRLRFNRAELRKLSPSDVLRYVNAEIVDARSTVLKLLKED